MVDPATLDAVSGEGGASGWGEITTTGFSAAGVGVGEASNQLTRLLAVDVALDLPVAGVPKVLL